jgi:adenylate cyclase class IV
LKYLSIHYTQDDSAELISYERSDLPGPRLCSYDKITLNPNVSQHLINILSQSIGVFGTVNKTRQLYMIGQTRVHVDKVDDLGNFIEIEASVPFHSFTLFSVSSINEVVNFKATFLI